MTASEGFQKLKEHYLGCITPGVILGDAEAIVGQFSLEVCYFDRNLQKHCVRFLENEKLKIIEFHKDYLLVDIGWTNLFKAPYEKFKGFSFKNKMFIKCH